MQLRLAWQQYFEVSIPDAIVRVNIAKTLLQRQNNFDIVTLNFSPFQNPVNRNNYYEYTGFF